MNDPIRFGVIGCGMLARAVHLPNLVAMPEACLHTCCDVNEDNLAACAEFSPRKSRRDFRDVVADPEVTALLVATTEAFRVPIIEAAAAAGKPVFCEKPLADSPENARRIEEMVARSGIPFCVGHNRRCSPAMVEARELFVSHARTPRPCLWRYQRDPATAARVGSNPGAPVLAIRVNDDWMSWKAVHLESPLNREVGLLLSEATHFTDLANWFLESRPTRVFCSGQGVLNHAILIHYENGAMATVTMAGTGSFGYPKELLEVMGHGAVVAVDHMLEIRTAGLAGAPAVKTYPMLNDRHPSIGQEGGVRGWILKKRAACEEAEAAGSPSLQFTAEPDKGHARMLREFCREIRGERPPVCPVEDAALALRVCFAAITSYREGRVVDLDSGAETLRQ